MTHKITQVFKTGLAQYIIFHLFFFFFFFVYTVKSELKSEINLKNTLGEEWTGKEKQTGHSSSKCVGYNRKKIVQNSNYVVIHTYHNISYFM